MSNHNATDHLEVDDERVTKTKTQYKLIMDKCLFPDSGGSNKQEQWTHKI